MLTRIEIDGFKSFEGFALDLDPFAVVLGGNASGKSNLFDAIQFLSRLAETDLRTASKTLRGEATGIFREAIPGKTAERMRFATEVLLDPLVRDPWGKEVELGHTRIRYELEIERFQNHHGIERLKVTRESALPILGRDDRWRPFGQGPSGAFRKAFLKYAKRSPFLETLNQGDAPSFKIHQDGSQGRNRPASAAEATVLSSLTTTDFPHLYALREEMRSWRLLQLDPMGIRRPSPLQSDETLLPDGSNLAAVLYRIQAETRDDDHPDGTLPDIVAELAAIVPGVTGVVPELNEAAHEYRAKLRLQDGFAFPTAVISDGTLRVLALVTLLCDPRHRGLVCFEEPENGVHPARLKALMGRLRDLVTDPTPSETDAGEGLSQLLMNSHSPVVLSALRESAKPGQILFADLVSVADPATRSVRRKTRIRPVGSSDQGFLVAEGEEPTVSGFEVQQYLSAVRSQEA